MFLTNKNAAAFVGKKLYGKMFHYYPLRVEKKESGYFIVDKNGTSMPLVDSDPVFFSAYSDDNETRNCHGCKWLDEINPPKGEGYCSHMPAGFRARYNHSIRCNQYADGLFKDRLKKGE